MAYSASDYPQVKRAAQAYDVAKEARLKAQRSFDETSTRSPKYEQIAATLAAAKKQEEAKLAAFRSANDAAKADYDRKSISVKATADAKSARVAIESLDERLKKAEDSGQDTTKIVEEKTAAEKKLKDAVAAKKAATKKTPTVVETTESKAEAAKKKAVTPETPTTGEKPRTPPTVAQDPLALAKKEAARTKKLGAASRTDVATSDYAQRNTGMATAPKTPTGTKTATGTEDINAIYALARSKYDNVDSIFLYDPELKQILIDAVGDIATAKDDMEPDEFLRRLNASDWAIRNASTYRARDAQRREYNETLDKYNKQLEMADTQEKKDAILSKIGQLNTTSSYARGLASAKAFIEATASGLTGTMDPKRLDAFVKKMYDSANDKDENIINRELAALISYKPGTQLGGSVGADLTKLRATARANGFDLDTTFKDQINNWMQRLAVGESVETFQNTIRSQAKLGLPDKVANLLDQGLDLANIYAPYKNVMAAVLEVAPDSISLSDATLRSAIGPEKEMSLYDFQRTLRKDPRWQYTNNAREESSDAVLGVLRNFGFQG
jgi:hypothetical protein